MEDDLIIGDWAMEFLIFRHRERRQIKKDEEEVNPAAKKKAKEKKSAEDARYRMKRYKEMEVVPVKKQAMYLRQKDYDRKRYSKRCGVAVDDEYDEEDRK
jgi:hypothetical protein